MSRKSVTMVSNNYWTLYKFRYDVIQMFMKKGYHVTLVARRDQYHQKLHEGFHDLISIFS